jgi:hypothetical protein
LRRIGRYLTPFAAAIAAIDCSLGTAVALGGNIVALERLIADDDALRTRVLAALVGRPSSRDVVHECVIPWFKDDVSLKT